jgi:hypothetical protein
MVGFPGFSNPGFVDEVADATATRRVRAPYGSFQEEASSYRGPETLLLRHDVDPSVPGTETLEGVIKLRYANSIYRLMARFTPDAEIFWAYSAHTNKTHYLTSHLYAFLETVHPGVRAALTVEYELSRE